MSRSADPNDRLASGRAWAEFCDALRACRTSEALYTTTTNYARQVA